jgi:hypothetical protein
MLRGSLEGRFGAEAIELIPGDCGTVLGALVPGLAETGGIELRGQFYNVFRVRSGRIPRLTITRSATRRWPRPALRRPGGRRRHGQPTSSTSFRSCTSSTWSERFRSTKRSASR